MGNHKYPSDFTYLRVLVINLYILRSSEMVK